QLAEIAAPEHTAIVTQECQGAVIGPHAGLALLAEEARRVALPNIVRLLPAARAAGVSVVHCLVARRPDGLGSNHNAKIFAGGRTDLDIAPGSAGAALLAELGPDPSDIVLHRWHGVGPMGGTDLDAILRNLGVSTIVGVGVSLNIAIPNLVIDAVNAGYEISHSCPGRRQANRPPPPDHLGLLQSLLPAVDPLLHRSVPVALGFDDFAAAEGPHIGFGCGFSASSDLAEDDHVIVVGEETAGRC